MVLSNIPRGLNRLIGRDADVPALVALLPDSRLVTLTGVEQARTQRRSDLPGEPLVWREALCRMLVELAGRRCA